LIEDCQIYPKSINPESGDAVINYRITANDLNVQNAFDNNDLSIDPYDGEINGDMTKSVDAYDTVKYFNLTYPLKYNLKDENDEQIERLELKARPVITSDGINIKYPDGEPYIVDLKNIFSDYNTSIAQEYFTYIVDNEAKTTTFTFDVDASVVTTGEVALKLSALKYTDYVDAGYPDVSEIAEDQ